MNPDGFVALLETRRVERIIYKMTSSSVGCHHKSHW